MPIPVLGEIFFNGLSAVPYADTVLFKFAPWVTLVYLLRRWFGGARDNNDRVLHGKVIMVTVCPMISPFFRQALMNFPLTIGRHLRYR